MRFHCGISFSWRTIKKFLLPFLVGLLAYFGFNGIFDNFNFGFIKVFASTNMNTKYNVTMYDYKTYMENKTCGGITMYDYINNFINSIDWSQTQYQIFIGANFAYDHSVNDIKMYFVQTAYVNQSQGHRIWTFGLYQSSGWTYQFKTEASKATYPAGHMIFYFNNCTSTTNMDDLTSYLTNLVNNGTYIPNYSHLGINYSSGSTYYSTNWSMSSLNNNSSYDIGGWWYYSSYDLYYANSSEASGTNKYWKTIHIVDNDTNYGYEDKLPSYYDIYYTPPIPEPSYIGYQTSLDTFYTNLDPSNINSYSLKVKFRVPQSILGYYQTPQEYIDNTTFDFACGGRVDHTNYYSYETFPCSLSSSYITTSNSIEYTFNNIITSQSLTNYDKLYVTINSNYLDSNVSTTMFDLSYTYNLGGFYNTTYKGVIFENFDNLPLDFSMYFSSNNPQSQSKLYVDTSYLTNDIYTLGFSNTNQNESYAVGQSILANPSQYENLLNFKLTHVSNTYDTGIMIFQQNGSRRLEHLYLFFNGGMYISNKINNNEYYYIDNTGTITTGNFNQPVINNNNDSYDISYYTSYVSNFIDGLSSSSLILSTYTQDFYNGLPIYFQTFLFVMFILGCIYIIYNLIRK